MLTKPEQESALVNSVALWNANRPQLIGARNFTAKYAGLILHISPDDIERNSAFCFAQFYSRDSGRRLADRVHITLAATDHSHLLWRGFDPEGVCYFPVYPGRPYTVSLSIRPWGEMPRLMHQ
jgi:hypothetical protein